MAVDRIQTGLRLKPQDLAKITTIAKKENRSLNGQIEYIVLQYIQDYESVHGPVEIDSEP